MAVLVRLQSWALDDQSPGAFALGLFCWGKRVLAHVCHSKKDSDNASWQDFDSF